MNFNEIQWNLKSLEDLQLINFLKGREISHFKIKYIFTMETLKDFS